MAAYEYGIADFEYVAAGAAVLASGGGGSYVDALGILEQLAEAGWSGTVPVRDYDGATNCCVLAMMGSPDAATDLTLENVECSIINTLNTLEPTLDEQIGCLIPVETGPINSIVPLIAAAMAGLWVVDGDGAGRAVPELPQTTYGGSANLPAAPCALANDVDDESQLQSAVLNAPTAAAVETLAGGVVSAFGSFSGIALWTSDAGNGYALQGNYIAGTLSQARALGEYLLNAEQIPSSAEVALAIGKLTGRLATVVAQNLYVTEVTQSTSSASLDAGIIRLDNAIDQADSTETCYIYNLNENLIVYSSASAAPLVVAPDSICYYSESTGAGFSNATNDLAVYFDFDAGTSTGESVSLIKVETAPELYNASGVVESFAGLLRQIGYAGAMPAK